MNHRSRAAVAAISGGGWVLTVVAAAFTYRSLGTIDSVAIAAVGVCTLLLLRRRDFPRRREGLMSSWVGPLLITIGVTVTKPLFLGTGHGGDVPAIARGIIAGVLLTGLFSAAVMAWLLRGYGLIPIMALVACVLPSRSGRLEREARDQYPPRWWWVVPAGILILYGVLTVIVYLVTRNAPSLGPQM